jgi:hypothetical protein
MNVLSSTPSVLALESCSRPAPSTKRKRSGWISAVTIRRRSLAKRISSRRHTILIARSSLRQLRAGTRTLTISEGRSVVLIAASR